MLRSLMTSVVLLAVAAGAAQAGPVSEYYLTAGDQGQNWVLQGSSSSMSGQVHGAEYAIAVDGDVRTFGYTGGQGSQYTLGLVPTGIDYNAPSASVDSFFDGTTDGTFNYSVGYFNGLVYRMNRDWSNPTALFDTGNNGAHSLGITYDTLTNSLWVSQWDGSAVSNFTLSGILLSSFNVGFNRITSLAYDPADGSLWMGTQNDFGASIRTFYQYSTSGQQLSTAIYADLSGQNYLGGEFDITPSAVPEPSSLALVVLAALTGGIFRFRRRHVTA